MRKTTPLAAGLSVVGPIYLLLKSMGEEGVEIAAPGSCKSGRCGVRRKPEEAALPDAAEENQRKDNV